MKFLESFDQNSYFLQYYFIWKLNVRSYLVFLQILKLLDYVFK